MVSSRLNSPRRGTPSALCLLIATVFTSAALFACSDSTSSAAQSPNGGASGSGGASSTVSGGAGGSTGIGGQQSTSDASAGDARATDGGIDATISRVALSAKPTPVGGATKVTDSAASDGYSVGVGQLGQGAELTGVPAATKLAIRYASVSVGTISVAVNDQTARKVNVHSSGALTGSFIYAIIDIAIPANAKLTVSRAANDVAVNIDRLIIGDGDLGLPPDIWNLPSLPVAAGSYTADWKALSLAYTVPEWWREAKLGAWSHWDPQSMPEQGDWYSRKMYQEGDPVYAYHVAHFGHPSEYGYKDICKNWVIDRWKPDELMDLYVEMGAHFFMAMGVHHDNFDCWDSAYQPWNSVRVGPKVDVVGTWEKSARARGLAFRHRFSQQPRSNLGPIHDRPLHQRFARGQRRAFPTMHFKRFWMEKGNGGREWIRSISMARLTTSTIRCIHLSEISSCGAWMMPSPSTIPI